MTFFINLQVQGDTSLYHAVHCWLTLDKKLPPAVTESEYYKKQRKLGMSPVAVASYLFAPEYIGLN